jgi:hypothetical protein
LKEWENLSGEKYTVVNTIVSRDIPIKTDGYQYTIDEFINVLNGKTSSHNPDIMSYENFIEKFDLIELKNQGVFDEIHMFGAPYMGFYESRMIGKNAIWCNSPPLIVPNCENFIMMGFSYERGVSEGVHDFGHRTESTLRFCYPKFYKELIDKVGTVHVPFNATLDYDWSNKTFVENIAESLPESYETNVNTNSQSNWFLLLISIILKFFSSKFANKKVEIKYKMDNCEMWGCNELGYLKFWFNRIPKYMWEVIIYPNKIAVKE